MLKEIHVLSWGGGTQSTALMLKMLEQQKPIDYIIFSDTGDESVLTYNQIYKVQKYVEDTYNREIIIVKRNKEKKTDDEIIEMVKEGNMTGTSYRSSPYADLYQNQVLFYKGVLDRADIVPSWVINKHGELGKLMGRQCTIVYKINQIIKEIRARENLSRFDAKKHRIIMNIGFTIDEISRVKPSPMSYINNVYPLIEMSMTKIDCIEYVEKRLGFKPRSSVCNMCYANDFNRVYEIYQNDKVAWDKLLVLDDAMANKSNNHRIRGNVYMFQWQAKIQKRLKNIDMNQLYKDRNKYHQLSIFDMEQEMACMGGCFL